MENTQWLRTVDVLNPGYWELACREDGALIGLARICVLQTIGVSKLAEEAAADGGGATNGTGE